MKRLKSFLEFTSIFLILNSFICCTSDNVETNQNNTDTPIVNSEVIDENTEDEITEDQSESIIVEVEPEEVQISEDDQEYLRSTNNLDEFNSITKQEFNDDKAAILKIISELSLIMDTKDSKKWLTYIDPESITYYSNAVNLRNAQKKLPTKQIVLKDISDYFYYVFIPSRKRSQVDEIRYISKTNIKAVQVKEDFSTVVYYYFTKKDGKWLVHLPPV